MTEATAVADFEYEQMRQFISGYHLGYTRKKVWRIKIEIGSHKFTSRKTYASEDAAKRAAKRFNKGMSA